MKLKLQLGKSQFVWALVEPLARNFIKSSAESGYQEVNLIVSQGDSAPVEVNLEDYPNWAQKQILTAIRSGQLINTGDKIDTPAATKVEEVKEVAEAKEAPAKPRARRSRKKKTA